MSSPVLRVVGLTKRFGPVAALSDLSLSVGPGRLLAVVGENGAGKSTLVRCVAGELPFDAGQILIDDLPLGDSTVETARQGVAVVWQDLGLCEDLDVVANVFLGRERGRLLLAETAMQEAARTVLDDLGARVPDLRVRTASLSRGQRQQVALARAIAAAPRVLVLDEPTASLGATERARVLALLRRRLSEGTTILLATHDLTEAFSLADRIVVLRGGRLVAEVSPLEVHPDDVTALMSGIETDSMARRQLHRLQSLAEQLSGAEPAASLPIIVSAAAAALDQEMLCVHLLDHDRLPPVLRRSAAIGLPPALLAVNGFLPVGTDGGSVGLATATEQLVVVEDVATHPAWRPYRDAARACGIRSAWAAPIVGSRGVIGAISGYSTTSGRPPADRLELVSLYATHAAAAIERERLLAEVTRRNRVLESLRRLLETLAGPERVDGGLSVALLALCRGLGAAATAVLVERHGQSPRWTTIALSGADDDPMLRRLAEATASDAAEGRVAPGQARQRLPLPDGHGVLVARWDDPGAPGDDALELLADASRSLALAIEREALEGARREAAAARRSQALQRELLQRLSHELRTPLTAIHGYASTLLQPDLTWDDASTERFLAAIASESARMERLVGDLLDSSAIESGLLRLQRDWTDLTLVAEAARSCIPERDRIDLVVEGHIEQIWADHDRLEQVLVNLLDNAIRHGAPDTTATTVLRAGHHPDTVEVQVINRGTPIPAELLDRLFEPRVRGERGGAGLGLAIARGIVEAHGGTCRVSSDTDGTVVTIVLPTEPPAQEEADGAASWELAATEDDLQEGRQIG